MTKLWKHQQALVDFALENQRVLWVAGCGVGKTLAALTLAKQYERVLVITTKAALTVWSNDAKKHGIATDIIVLNKGTSKHKATQLLKLVGSYIVVTNYDTAKLLPLHKVAWDLVIADECHKLKAHNSQTSLLLATMLKDVPSKVGMTGTFNDERPTDVYGQIRWLYPEKVGRKVASSILGTWDEFFVRYCVFVPQDRYNLVTGYKNLDVLAESIAPYVMRVDRKTAIDLPDELHIEREVLLTSKQREVYNSMRKDFVAKIEAGDITASNVLVHGLRLQQLTSNIAKLDEGGIVPIDNEDAKLEQLLSLLDELGEEPVVVFTNYRQEVSYLLSKLPYECKQLTGDKKEHEDWQAGNGRVLLANLSAGAEGIDLTRARYAVYYSMPNSNTRYQQSLARISRPNSRMDMPVAYYYLVATDTVDTALLRGLRTKQDLAKIVLDNLANV